MSAAFIPKWLDRFIDDHEWLGPILVVGSALALSVLLAAGLVWLFKTWGGGP